MPLDNDLIDSAIDAAEAKIEATTATEVESTETTVEKEIEITDLAKIAQEKNQEYKDKASKLKGKSGKAIKANETAEISDQQQTDETIEAEVQGQEPQGQTPIDHSPVWSADEKNVIAKAPREVQEIVSRKVAQLTNGYDRIANESARAREFEAKTNAVFEPHRLKLQHNGIRSIDEAASRLLAWNEIFEQDPVTAIRDLVLKNNLTPQDIFDVDGEGAAPLDPRVEEAIREAKEAKELAEQQRQNFEQQYRSAVDQELENFKNSNDANGQPRRAFIDMYEPQIANVVKILRQEHPNLSRSELLLHATNFMQEEVTKLHGAPAHTIPQAKAPAKKAAAASGSVVGAPSSTTLGAKARAKGETWDEKLENALDMAEERHSARH